MSFFSNIANIDDQTDLQVCSPDDPATRHGVHCHVDRHPGLLSLGGVCNTGGSGQQAMGRDRGRAVNQSVHWLIPGCRCGAICCAPPFLSQSNPVANQAGIYPEFSLSDNQPQICWSCELAGIHHPCKHYTVNLISILINFACFEILEYNIFKQRENARIRIF